MQRSVAGSVIGDNINCRIHAETAEGLSSSVQTVTSWSPGFSDNSLIK